MGEVRESVKRSLALLPSRPARGATVLIYHRVGGGTSDELDIDRDRFAHQLDLLSGARVVSLDRAWSGVQGGEHDRGVVLTFDDGFAEVYHQAWPLLRERQLPFTVYLTSGCVGGEMTWSGSTARSQGAAALTWSQLEEMLASGLCTVGNHTHRHVRPEHLDEAELDECNHQVERHLGVVPRHFAYTWGVPVPGMEQALRDRFATAATGELGRVHDDTDPLRLPRIPVRRTDPPAFFRAKVFGGLGPERAYDTIVSLAKRVGVRG